MSTIYGKIDQYSRNILRDDSVIGVKEDVAVDVITFVFPADFDAVDVRSAAKKVFYIDANKELKTQSLLTTTVNSDGDYEVPWTLPTSLLKNAIRTTIGVSLTETGSGGKVSKRWVTKDLTLKIHDSICSDEAEVPIEEDDYDRLAALVQQALEAAGEIGDAAEIISGISGSHPTVVPTLADRTDPSKIYVVTANGHLYYHDGTDWMDAGVYGGSGPVTTFDQPGKAIESKAVGDKLGTIGSKFLNDDWYIEGKPITYGISLVNSANMSYNNSYIAQAIVYVTKRLIQSASEIVAYVGDDEGQPSWQEVYVEYGGAMVGGDATVINGNLALLAWSDDFIVCRYINNQWTALTDEELATYITSHPFAIYATVEL